MDDWDNPSWGTEEGWEDYDDAMNAPSSSTQEQSSGGDYTTGRGRRPVPIGEGDDTPQTSPEGSTLPTEEESKGEGVPQDEAELHKDQPIGQGDRELDYTQHGYIPSTEPYDINDSSYDYWEKTYFEDIGFLQDDIDSGTYGSAENQIKNIYNLNVNSKDPNKNAEFKTLGINAEQWKEAWMRKLNEARGTTMEEEQSPSITTYYSPTDLNRTKEMFQNNEHVLLHEGLHQFRNQEQIGFLFANIEGFVVS